MSNFIEVKKEREQKDTIYNHIINQHWRLTVLRWSLGGRNAGLPEKTLEHVALEWRWQRWVLHRMYSWPETARAQWHSGGPNLSVPLSENHHGGFTSTLQQPGNSETPAEANISIGIYNLTSTSSNIPVHFVLPRFIAIKTYSHHFSAAFLPSLCYREPQNVKSGNISSKMWQTTDK